MTSENDLRREAESDTGPRGSLTVAALPGAEGTPAPERQVSNDRTLSRLPLKEQTRSVPSFVAPGPAEAATPGTF